MRRMPGPSLGRQLPPSPRHEGLTRACNENGLSQKRGLKSTEAWLRRGTRARLESRRALGLRFGSFLVTCRQSIFVRNVPFDADESDLKEVGMWSILNRSAASNGFGRGLPPLWKGQPWTERTEGRGLLEVCGIPSRGSVKMVADKTGPAVAGIGSLEPSHDAPVSSIPALHSRPGQARTAIEDPPSSSSRRCLAQITCAGSSA